MLKKILLVLAILMVIVCAALVYINKVLLPIQIKGMIMKSAEEQLHRKVTLRELFYHPIKGLVITGITVASKEKPEDTFVSVQEASARVMLLPLLKKKIVVTSLKIDAPAVHLVRFEPTLWNFSDLIKPQTETPKEKTAETPGYSLVISGIAITNGKLQVTDRAQETEFNENIDSINLHGSLALNAGLKLSGSLALPSTKGSLKFNANYSFKDKSFKGDLAIRNLVTERYLRFAPALPLAVRAFNISEADLELSSAAPSMNVIGSAIFPVVDFDPLAGTSLKTSLGLQKINLAIANDGSLSFQGEISAAGLAAKTSDGKSASGNLQATINKLTVNKTGTEFSGNVAADHLNVVPDPRFSAEAETLNLQKFWLLLSSDGTTAVRGAITTAGLKYKSTDGNQAEGNLQATIEKLVAAKAGTDFSGNLTADNLKMALGDSQSFTGNLRLSSARLNLKDGRISAAGNLEGQNMQIVLNKDLSVNGDLNWQDLSIVPSGNGMNVQGDLKLTKLAVALGQTQSLTGDIHILRQNISIDGSNVSGQLDLDLDNVQIATPDAKIATAFSAAETTFSFKNGVTEVSARPVFRQLSGNVKPALSFSGEPELTVHLTHDPKAPQPVSYNGTLALNGNGFNLSGLPTVDAVSGITGRIEFETDRAQLKDLNFSVLDTVVKVAGDITSFTKPRVNLDVAIASLELALAEKIIPQIFKEQELRLSGRADDITVHVEGAIADIANATIRAQAELKNISAESGKLKQKIEQVSGFISYEPPALSWKGLSVGYQGKTYVLNGDLRDFANPAVSGTVKSDDLKADFQIKKQGDLVQIERLAASWFETAANLTGSLDLTPGGEPSFSVDGDVKLKLTDLNKMLPAEQLKPIEGLKLDGTLTLKADASGKPAAWANWKSNVLLDAPSLSALGYQVEHLRITAPQKDGQVEPINIDGDFYEGVIHAQAGLNLLKPGFPVRMSFKLDSTNLAKLKLATPLKDKRLEGLLTFSAEIEGNLTDLNSLKGSGTLAVKDGYLFEVPGLSLLGGLLQSMAKIGDLAALNTVSANWQIEKGRVTTEDLHIKGQTVDILGQGWISLDQTLDMTFKPNLATANAAGGAAELVNASGILGEFAGARIFGPISKPKVEPLALNPVKAIGNILTNTTGNILKLFQ